MVGIYANLSPSFSQTKMVVVDVSDPPKAMVALKTLAERGTPHEPIITMLMLPVADAEKLKELQKGERLAGLITELVDFSTTHDMATSNIIFGGLIIVHPKEPVYQLDGTGDELAVPVLMIKSSDAVRLREHGSVLIQGARAPFRMWGSCLHVQCCCER